MKFFAHLAAVVLGLTSISAQAEVLVYSGTVRLTDLDTRRKPFVRKAFLVADPSLGEGTGSTQLVSYGKVGRIKTRETETVNVGYYFGGALGVNRPLLDIYSFVKMEDDPSVLRQSLFLRGFQKKLQVSLNQAQPVHAVRAKFLKGSSRIFITGSATTYAEREISLTFDRERTVDVNVRGITATAAFDEIVVFLESKGYTD